jgi:ubiquinone/menaquinone biosynthesis C-methylase UbiE
MGQWSRRLAPLLIRFGGLSDGERVLDVGCGTGSLTFTLPAIAHVVSVTGVDLTDSFVEFARGRNTDPRISFQTADASALPFVNDSFDRVFSMLVLQFIPDAARAVA